MTHEIEVISKYVWHDLTEDPNDLPMEPDDQYLVLMRNRVTDKLQPYFYYDYERYEAEYRSEDKLWIAHQENEFGFYDEIAFGSYGLEHSAEIEKAYGKDFSDFEVVAWVEEKGSGPEIYIPARWANRKDDEQ